MPNNDESKPYDLEDRTFEFAKASRAFVKKLPRTIANIEDELESARGKLLAEARELMKIFGAIVRKSEK